MRDHLLAVVQLALDPAPDRITPIVVAAIAAVSAIATTLIVVFARKPDDNGNALVKGLREDLRIVNKRVEQRDRRIEQDGREIDRLQALCWSHGIDPRPTPPTTSGGPT